MNINLGAEILDLQISSEPLSDIRDQAARIWRHMDLAKFIPMLQNEALYFSAIAALGDDMEAASPRLPLGVGPFEQMNAFSSWSLSRCVSFTSCWLQSTHRPSLIRR